MARNNKEKGRNDHIIEGSIMLGIGIVFMLILVGAFGKAGKAVTDFFVGTFGYAVYAYFLALIIIGILTICKVKRPNIKLLRLLSLLMFFAMVIALLHCVSSSQIADNGYGKYLSDCYNLHNTAGGVLAGLFLYPLLLVDFMGVVLCGIIAMIFGAIFVFYDTIIANLNVKNKEQSAKMVDFGGEYGIVEEEIVGNNLLVEEVDVKDKKKQNNNEEYVSLEEENTSKIDLGLFDNYTINSATSLSDRETVLSEKDKKNRRDTAFEILYGDSSKKQTEEIAQEKPVLDIGNNSEYQSYTNDYRKRQVIDGLHSTENELFSANKNEIANKDNKNDFSAKNDLKDTFGAINNAQNAEKDMAENKVDVQESKQENKLSAYEEFIRKNNQSAFGGEQKEEQNSAQKKSVQKPAEKPLFETKYERIEPVVNKEVEQIKEEKIDIVSGKFDDMPVEDKTATHNEIDGFEYLLKHQREERDRKDNEIFERRHNLRNSEIAEDTDEAENKFAEIERKRKERSDKGGVHNSSSKQFDKDVLEDLSAKVEEKQIQTNLVEQTATKEIEQSKPIFEQKVAPQPKPVEVEKVSEEVKKQKTRVKLAPYKFPPIELLKDYDSKPSASENFDDKIEILETTLSEFGIDAKVNNVVTGPTFSRLELVMPKGIPVKRVLSYVDDIAMCLEVKSVRCQIPIPGKNAFGVEIPNSVRGKVGLKSVIQSEKFAHNKHKLAFAVGQNCDGENFVADLAAMPHLLIAGATGAGKSVCLNSLIVSLIYKYTPEEMKILLVDPKQVELNMYNRIPHMLIPEAVSDKDKTLNLLDWAIEEMELRYTMFKDRRVQKITDYNATIDPKKEDKLPYIVIIIDEVGDFMMVMKKELEERIVRLTQKARAAGIHLILATQRPSVDVITGVIKANLPARIAFAVASFPDSKTILDQGGAEKLLRYGDMIFSDGVNDPERLQGTLIEGEEVNAICDYVRANNECYFDKDIEEFILNTNTNTTANAAQTTFGESSGEQDDLFVRALFNVISTGAVSISKLQRKFGIGFPRAARLVDTMEELGYIGAAKDNKQREILIDMPTFLSKYGDVSLE